MQEGDSRISKQEDSLDDLEIQIEPPRVIKPKRLERPKYGRWLGKRETRLPTVAYFNASAIADVWRHSTSVTDREVGGILVGKVFDHGGLYGIVEGSIIARKATERGASLTFTHESWVEMLKDLDELFPGRVVLGWYHTHPGYGIFLSSMDTHIHSGFFQRPYQVALVIEPIQGKIGMFQWYNRKLEKTACIQYIGSDEEANLVEKLVQATRRGRKLPAAVKKTRAVTPAPRQPAVPAQPDADDRFHRLAGDMPSDDPEPQPADPPVPAAEPEKKRETEPDRQEDEEDRDSEDYKGWTVDRRV